jgi:uncharacterized protein (UPF0333 family)
MASGVNVNLAPKSENAYGFAGLLVVVAIIGFIFYELFTNGFAQAESGLGGTVNAAANAATSVLGAANNIIQPVSTAVGELTGQDNSGTSLWTGINNFFTTGSIYGNQGSD